MKSSKGTLLQVDGEAVEGAEVEHTEEMLLMRGQGVGESQYVIKVDETKQKISKGLVHHSLESLGSVPEAKREAKELKESKGSDDGRLWNIFYFLFFCHVPLGD